MSSLSELQEVRYKKLERLQEVFHDIYPAHTNRTHSVLEVTRTFAQLQKTKKAITLTGRILALRPHGGAVFFDIEEDGSTLQGYLRKEDVDASLFQLFVDALDVGDFIEITGRAYTTRRDEKSLLVSRWRPLAKSLRPLPEKWHGLVDQEERYRTRALDLLVNTKARATFVMRAHVISFIRSYFDKLEFIEVETPMLQTLAGGATARPFITQHHALDMNLYLRIAPELYLKKLLVGGFTRVYELGRNFRNEGIDVTHNPEFTSVEAYIAYYDYADVMKFVERMTKKLVSKILKKKEFTYNGKPIGVQKPFRVISFYDALRNYALLPHVEKMTHEELVVAARRFGITVNTEMESVMLLEDIFRKAVRPHLFQPTFVTDWPTALLPLAKRKVKEPALTESFQLYIGGLELVKAFSELNDPRDQRERFSEQEKKRMRGDLEAQAVDEDFIENLEYGMPPAAGFAIGIDRLMMLLSDTHNLREVILFPTLRPR